MDTIPVFGSSVQEAVQATVRLGKPLFVFLSVNSEENSATFLEQFFHSQEAIDSEIGQLVTESFVTLKLVEDTVEFGYFQQIFSNLIVPSFYIIQNGKLLDVISGETTEAQFVEKVTNVIIAETNQISTGPETSQTDTNGANAANISNSSISSVPAPNTATQIHSDPVSDTSATNSTVANPQSAHDRTASEYHKQYLASRKKQEEERLRLRVLLQADQKERLSRQREMDEILHGSESTSPQPKSQSPAHPAQHDVCFLSIKLFDGSSLKHEFSSSDTLNTVREWLDKETEIIPPTDSLPSFASSSYPQPTNYAFHRPILPRETYTDEQEFQKLVDLGLCPRSALILKPIYDDKYSSSYPTNKTSGGILRGVGGTLARVGSALYSFFDYGVDDTQEHQHQDYDEPDGSRSPRDPTSPSRPSATASGSSRVDFPVRPPLFSIDNNEGPTSFFIDESNNPSVYNSRASTPKPLGLSSISRVQTIHDEQDDKDKKDVDTYNGNSVNLRGKDDEDKRG
ncbi:predicted protein [Scheffersomyces stipitis CBS 6054]|uniref:UBX domain-containing protein n=1 Tax=Scheffersomyces stipitis (strain ATCC 58785 / CBS 6054 / NBRC 10063 / NRRL Y-11545) TaxID=322104 RepID=A3LRC2_PICST|nr:predicted protein [Scheffersomyces stipitis CBS 6054]ABN65358.2 predicted protein [Scheffersomyces stipitis CBS 6054]